MPKTYIIGAGFSGMAAGYGNNIPIFEQNSYPGGVCASYYMKSNSAEKMNQPPKNEEAYRFERGAGLWIWGKNKAIREFIANLSPVDIHQRNAAVYIAEQDLIIPFPIQNNLRYLEKEIIEKVLQEIKQHSNLEVKTMADSFIKNFGFTLSEIFFNPFHESYTSGLYKKIAPPDSAKTPIDIDTVIAGSKGKSLTTGYNSNFIYPKTGMDDLARKMAKNCNVKYNTKVENIDTITKELKLSTGERLEYDYIISTLPLNLSLKLAKLETNSKNDPYTGTMVINIGAIKTKKCPNNHWLYISKSKNNFHRVGFYSNIEKTFLPLSQRYNDTRVSIYVEKSYLPESKPSKEEAEKLSNQIAEELKSWGWIADIEALSYNLIDVCYTWRNPGSKWVEEATQVLESENIYPVGRYAKWSLTEAIADSIRDGFIAGRSLS